MNKKQDDDFLWLAVSRTKRIVRKGRDPRAMVAAAYALGFEDSVKALARLKHQKEQADAPVRYRYIEEGD